VIESKLSSRSAVRSSAWLGLLRFISILLPTAPSSPPKWMASTEKDQNTKLCLCSGEYGSCRVEYRQHRCRRWTPNNLRATWETVHLHSLRAGSSERRNTLRSHARDSA